MVSNQVPGHVVPVPDLGGDNNDTTINMAITHRHYLPHRNFHRYVQFTLCSIIIVWSSVYNLGVHSCSIGVEDGKPGCHTSNDGFSECIIIKPCVRTPEYVLFSSFSTIFLGY